MSGRMPGDKQKCKFEWKSGTYEEFKWKHLVMQHEKTYWTENEEMKWPQKCCCEMNDRKWRSLLTQFDDVHVLLKEVAREAKISWAKRQNANCQTVQELAAELSFYFSLCSGLFIIQISSTFGSPSDGLAKTFWIRYILWVSLDMHALSHSLNTVTQAQRIAFDAERDAIWRKKANYVRNRYNWTLCHRNVLLPELMGNDACGNVAYQIFWKLSLYALNYYRNETKYECAE